MRPRRGWFVAAALLSVALPQGSAVGARGEGARVVIGRPHDFRRDQAPWVSRNGVRGIPSPQRLVELREAARSLARAEGHFAVQHAFYLDQRSANAPDLAEVRQALRSRQSDLDVAERNWNTARENLELSIERHPVAPPSRPEGIDPASLANARPLGLIPERPLPQRGDAQRQAWAPQSVDPRPPFDPHMLPQREFARQDRVRRGPIEEPSKAAERELGALRAMTRGNLDGSGGWNGRSGNVSLNPQYDLEFTSRGHLYGRPAKAYMEVYKKDQSTTKPRFEDWVAKLRALPKDSPELRNVMMQVQNGRMPLPTEVRYLSPQERDGYALRVNRSSGQLSIGAEPLNRSTPAAERPVVFVVDEGGRVYAGNYKNGSFHHSSLLAGGNVRGAGELLFDATGRLTAITSKSGHYLPDNLRVLQGLDALQKTGVNLDGVALRFPGRDEGFDAKTWLDRERWRLNDQGPLETPAAEAMLRNQPAGSWLLRQDGNGGTISYKGADGRVRHVPLNMQAGSPGADVLDTAVRGLHLDPTRMLPPATRSQGLLLLPHRRVRHGVATASMRLAA